MIDLNDVRRLLQQNNAHTLSLYLYTDNARQENQADTPAWRIEHKNLLADLERTLSGDDKRAFARARQQADDFLDATVIDSGKTMVLFATPDDVTTYSLPVALESSAAFGTPEVTPMLWAMDEYERYFIAQVDGERARFISAYLGGTDDEGHMRLEVDAYDFGEKTLMPRGSIGAPGTGDVGIRAGSHKDEFDDMIDEHVRRFHRDVADMIGKLADRVGAERIILSGEARAAHAVEDLLPQQVRARVVGIVPASLNVPEHTIMPELLPVAEQYERAREIELVQQVVDFAKARGRGALGLQATMDALEQQRVETLIVSYPVRDADLSARLPVRAVQSGSKIELVFGAAADLLNAEGNGIGARLYYALNTDNNPPSNQPADGVNEGVE